MSMKLLPEHLITMNFIRPKVGKEQELLDSVYKYIAEIQANEPDTISSFLIDIKEPAPDGGKEYCFMIRYKNQEAFDKHDKMPYYSPLKDAMIQLVREPVYTKPAAPLRGFMARM